MSTETNKTLVTRFFQEDLSGRDQAARGRASDEMVALDFVDHTNPPELKHGRESHKQIVNIFNAAFTDMVWHVDDLVAEGDKVVIRTTMTATHQGDFFGIAPTGRTVSYPGIHVLRIADGQVAEHWGSNDDLGLMRQLGAIPTQG